jgi:hypothetical protein
MITGNLQSGALEGGDCQASAPTMPASRPDYRPLCGSLLERQRDPPEDDDDGEEDWAA